MYARVIESFVASERLGAFSGFVRYELVPALRVDGGFCGAVSLLGRRRDRVATLLVLLWETEAEAARPLEARPALAALLGPCAVSIWEVNARA